MRTIVFEEPFSVTVRLEGELTAEVAADLCARVAMWQGLISGRKVRLDLGDVASIDAAGADCLRRLHERGVQLAAVGPALRELENELRPHGKENLRAWLARIGIQLSSPSPEKSQSWFRRVLCAVLPPGTAGCPCAR